MFLIFLSSSLLFLLLFFLFGEFHNNYVSFIILIISLHSPSYLYSFFRLLLLFLFIISTPLFLCITPFNFFFSWQKMSFLFQYLFLFLLLLFISGKKYFLYSLYHITFYFTRNLLVSFLFLGLIFLPFIINKLTFPQ